MQLKYFSFILLLFLSACGYQLRGSIDLPEGMENIYMENASGRLQQEVKNALKFSEAALVTKPEDAGVIIKILKERMKTHVVSVSSTGKANQFELSYNLTFSIFSPTGELLLENQTITSQRNYFNDQEEILAQTNEEQLIRNEMYNQAVRSIIIRARLAMENNQKNSTGDKKVTETTKVISEKKANETSEDVKELDN